MPTFRSTASSLCIYAALVPAVAPPRLSLLPQPQVRTRRMNVAAITSAFSSQSQSQSNRSEATAAVATAAAAAGVHSDRHHSSDISPANGGPAQPSIQTSPTAHMRDDNNATAAHSHSHSHSHSTAAKVSSLLHPSTATPSSPPLIPLRLRHRARIRSVIARMRMTKFLQGPESSSNAAPTPAPPATTTSSPSQQMRAVAADAFNAAHKRRRARRSNSMSIEDAVRAVFHPTLIQRFREVQEARRRASETSAATVTDATAVARSAAAFRYPAHPLTLLHRWRRIISHLLLLGGSSLGNAVTVYADGASAFQAMWRAIAHAEESIRMEAYIVECDSVGSKTLRLLIAAAKRGVDVKFSYDGWGSSTMLLQSEATALLEELRAAGGTVMHFNPLKLWLLRAPWRNSPWFRNHRKILVVDSRIGFCGGMNVSADYYPKVESTQTSEADNATAAAGVNVSGTSPDGLRSFPASSPLSVLSREQVIGTGKFRDTHLQITGPAVRHLEQVSRDTFHEAEIVEQQSARAAMKEEERATIADEMAAETKQGAFANAAGLSTSAAFSTSANTRALRLRPYPTRVYAAATNVALLPKAPYCPVTHPLFTHADTENLFVQVLPSNVWRNKRLIQRSLLLTVRQAKSCIYITNPYFFPPPSLFRALQAAAERGVRINVLMAGEGKSDVPTTRWASQHIYHAMLRRGIQIYELQNATLHAKTVTIDGVYSSVGSFNWDRLSARRNLEVNVSILDPSIAHTLEQHFHTDLAHAKQITLDSLRQRNFFQRVLHRVSYWIMRYI